MLTEDRAQEFLKGMLPKVLKALVKGLFWFFLLYFLPNLLLSDLAQGVMSGYTEFLFTFALVIVFFVMVSELLAGTIFQYAFDIGKALVFMLFFIYALNGGFFEFDFETVHIEADLRVYLAMLLIIDFIGLAKSLLQAIDFLAKKTERQLAI